MRNLGNTIEFISHGPERKMLKKFFCSCSLLPSSIHKKPIRNITITYVTIVDLITNKTNLGKVVNANGLHTSTIKCEKKVYAWFGHLKVISTAQKSWDGIKFVLSPMARECIIIYYFSSRILRNDKLLPCMNELPCK